jgi:SAM-dependent methyltransferase
MSVFGRYSSYYDLLYKDKNYQAEVEFVTKTIWRFQPHAKDILELGCGSGGHALTLAKQGFDIHGLDLSQDMLNIAKQQLALQPEDLQKKICFAQADIREFDIHKKFDAVISLFHVISYLPTLDDIQKTFTKVYEHLNPGGVFLFDIWYSPAVLTEKPTVRVKQMANTDIAVTRIAEPIWHPNECWVDVCYKVFIRDLKTQHIDELETEIHRMHYLSLPEIELLAKLCGLKIIHTSEWMTENPPSEKTWGVCFVLKKLE